MQTASSAFPPLGDERNTCKEKQLEFLIQERARVNLLCEKNTCNFTLLAGRSLQFSPLVLLADHSHMCKRWTSKPKEQS